MKTVRIGPYNVGNHCPLLLIAGPCVMEGLDFALRSAEALQRMAAQAGLPLVYKSSFDKANRTSATGARGPGLMEGLAILERVRTTLGLPVVTDVHTLEQVQPVAQVVDLLQTPAFLCRQTDFIQGVAAAGKPVNLKKGQFLAPMDMAHVAAKAAATGNDQLLLCERGTTFGYRDLVVDLRSLAILSETGYPVVFDATHSVQRPSGLAAASGGERQFAPLLARAAVTAGIAALFLETHPDPDQAPCDGPNMIPFDWLPQLLATVKRIDDMIKETDHGLPNPAV
ncbi:MAG: 3-deoxy-8-phosphooctulonate synthase [Magnetococcales bacterium]|nr:3-deoxy-8-phosphooctulonate synthase [Magnetococcales bacterium]